MANAWSVPVLPASARPGDQLAAERPGEEHDLEHRCFVRDVYRALEEAVSFEGRELPAADRSRIWPIAKQIGAGEIAVRRSGDEELRLGREADRRQSLLKCGGGGEN